mmetsp:Transcript_108725/g.307530  ORF Transcript_108725/g.307530 Transcript_108725/m.307530 type:complete len:112 (-) Transcript_108725:102-437(-)
MSLVASGGINSVATTVLQKKLQETGERERLKQYIRSSLNENGWREDLKTHCIEYIKSKGIEKVTIEEMVQDIAPRGRASLPDALKTELLNKLRTFAEQQGLEAGGIQMRQP